LKNLCVYKLPAVISFSLMSTTLRESDFQVYPLTHSTEQNLKMNVQEWYKRATAAVRKVSLAWPHFRTIISTLVKKINVCYSVIMHVSL